jgi:hypothetical protein
MEIGRRGYAMDANPFPVEYFPSWCDEGHRCEKEILRGHDDHWRIALGCILHRGPDNARIYYTKDDGTTGNGKLPRRPQAVHYLFTCLSESTASSPGGYHPSGKREHLVFSFKMIETLLTLFHQATGTLQDD